MKLLHDDIILLLKNALKLKKSSAEELLAQWVSIVKKSVENNEIYYVDGLGTFYSEGGKLAFRPDEKLAIEVNYKYAGMNPIELSPAYARESDIEKDADEDPFDLSDEISDDIIFNEKQEADHEDISVPSDFDEDLDDIFATEDENFGIGSEEGSAPEVAGEAGDESEEADEDLDDIFATEGEDFGIGSEEGSAPEVAGEAGDESEEADEELDDIFATEGEEFGAPSEEESESNDTGDSGDNSEDPNDKKSVDDVENAKEITGLNDYIPPLESPIGKTTGIGIRPASRKLEKSGKARKSTVISKEKEESAESVTDEKVSDTKAELVESNSTKNTFFSKQNLSESKIWLLPIAAVLILVILLVFHFADRDFNWWNVSESESSRIVILPSDENAELQDESATAGSEEETRQQSASAGFEEESSQLDEESITESLPETTEEEVSPFGLMGPVDEVNVGAYTIVLHSIANENRAEIEKRGLVEEGYKATIWRVNLPDGSTTWRVGVGQFASLTDANTALQELPEPYRSNNFIVRIR